MRIGQLAQMVEAVEAHELFTIEDAERVALEMVDDGKEVVDVVYKEFGKDGTGCDYVVFVEPVLDIRYRKLGLRLRYRWIRGRRCKNR